MSALVRSPILAVDDLYARYESAQALFGVSFTLQEGTCLALLGPNGAGKSTLGRCLSGLVPVTSGSIEFEETNITNMAPFKIRRQGLVYLPEGRGIFPGLSVIDNLRMAVRVLSGRAERAEAIDRMFDMFPVLGSRRAQKAATLSGGEQQMLSVASGLAVSPRVLIADELSLGLAPIVIDALFDSLAKVRETKTAVILIEQYIHRALDFCDECAILRRGKVRWHGDAANAGEDILSQYLGDSVEEGLYT